MARITKGMDVEQIEQMGARLQNDQVERVRAVARDIDQMVANVQWLGRDAERFRGWWPEKRAQLNAVANDLHGFGQSALNNASEQQIVSGAREPFTRDGGTSSRVGQVDSRNSLEEITLRYQVDPDEVVEFSKWYLPGHSQLVTATEAELLGRLTPLELAEMVAIRDRAFAEASRQYEADGSTYSLNDGHNDAFRHAYWNALMTRRFGGEWTEAFATAHEALPDNPEIREAMDLYNNEVGRHIPLSNPNADDDELARLIRAAVDDGDLVVVGESGRLEYSNNVEVGQHGESPATVKEPNGGLRIDREAKPGTGSAS